MKIVSIIIMTMVLSGCAEEIIQQQPKVIGRNPTLSDECKIEIETKVLVCMEKVGDIKYCKGPSYEYDDCMWERTGHKAEVEKSYERRLERARERMGL